MESEFIEIDEGDQESSVLFDSSTVEVLDHGDSILGPNRGTYMTIKRHSLMKRMFIHGNPLDNRYFLITNITNGYCQIQPPDSTNSVSIYKPGIIGPLSRGMILDGQFGALEISYRIDQRALPDVGDFSRCI